MCFCVCAFSQGAAVTRYRDGVVHGHVLPPSPSQSDEILSTTTRTVLLIDCAVVCTVAHNQQAM